MAGIRWASEPYKTEDYFGISLKFKIVFSVWNSYEGTKQLLCKAFMAGTLFNSFYSAGLILDDV